MSRTAAPITPGSRGFVVVLSMCIATTALGVDTVLPAYDEIRTSLGLAVGATEVTGLVTFYLMGNAAGLLPAGLLADRFGRRAVMWAGLVLYVVGAVGSILAPTLATMLVARFVWGLGSAGPRVAAVAMVRDGFVGEQMARQMSLIMAVFMIVPAVAPAMSAGLLTVGPWESVFWTCAVLAVVVAAAVSRLPETLVVADRRPLAARAVGSSLRTVVTTPGIPAYLVSLTALQGVFVAYLSGSELIIDQTYDLRRWFPLFFGVLSIGMLVGMLLNGRFVERLGLFRAVGLIYGGNLVVVGSMLVTALLTDGVPPFWAFAPLAALVLFFQQLLIPNLNASAMRPLAGVAGTGAAVLGMVPGVLGAVIGETVNRRFDGTVTPLAVGFVAATLVSGAAWWWAERGSTA